jgi:hypothetical protein
MIQVNAGLTEPAPYRAKQAPDSSAFVPATHKTEGPNPFAAYHKTWPAGSWPFGGKILRRLPRGRWDRRHEEATYTKSLGGDFEVASFRMVVWWFHDFRELLGIVAQPGRRLSQMVLIGRAIARAILHPLGEENGPGRHLGRIDEPTLSQRPYERQVLEHRRGVCHSYFLEEFVDLGHRG